MYRLLLTSLLLAVTPFSMVTAAQLPDTAPGYGKLGYPLPEIGSYALPSLGRAANGEIIDSRGQRQSLHDIFSDRYVLLAFIYSTCSDVNGCPLSSHVFYKIKSAMKRDAELADRLKMVSLSFDPENDTPEVMRLYSNNFRYAGKAGEWQFITTASQQQLQPILRAYNQVIQREVDSKGNPVVGFSHVLRVFLIDPDKAIRNIYSVDFLHHELIINDLKTLLRQETVQGRMSKTAVELDEPARLSKPGDDKQGYEEESYVTRSLDLESRRGEAADLLGIANSPPLGLPPIPVPADNPLTREKIELGRRLFFDRRLSLNDTFSCAMCHVPEQGFTSNELAMAVGIEGRSVRRNSPTVYNSAYASLLFHDGREESLEQQVWGPLLARNEMANPSVGYVLQKIRDIDDYDGRFEAAFDGRGVSMETLG
ncbi:MAG: cytochrome c peroxidase, partial [Candidatus Thiodiazotropha sp.]